MSELIQKNDNRATIRWKLLTGVSALALAAYTVSADVANADDANRPTVWIELGGQAERVDGAPELFSPPFFNLASPADLAALKSAQEFSPFSMGLEGSVSFQPEDSDWVFSAGIRYGRSGNRKHKHNQGVLAPPVHGTVFGYPQIYTPLRATYADAGAATRESHDVIDFQVGKDVGLGMFGAHGASIVSAGVRFAQFTANSHATLRAQPLAEIGPYHTGLLYSFIPYSHIPDLHDDHATALVKASRSTRAVGPSLSWNASLPVAGNSSDMSLNVDWGANAALLFGRQRARVHHQTHGYHYTVTGIINIANGSYTHGPYNRTRSRNVTIPNAGGFAGLSLKFPNAKVSIGYRADMFFGAIDGGIDMAKKENRAFYGPYASISVGIGD